MAQLGLSAEELRVQLVSELKYLEDIVAHVERRFASLATNLGGVVRKSARLRDKGDLVVKTLLDFAGSENGQMKKSLEGVAECCSTIEDCNQLKIDRMECKVVKPLLEYDSICRKALEELRTAQTIGEKEVTKQRALDRARIKDPSNRKKLLESDLQKVRIERTRSFKAVETYVESFEKKRTADFKTVMTEYIHTEMVFHAKALEVFTQAHQNIQNINEEEVIELYHKGLAPRMQQIQGQVGRQSRSASPMSTLAEPSHH